MGTLTTTSPDQHVWSAGDYTRLSPRLVGLAERLADAADLCFGERLLDVACGDGNLALAAARRGAEVTAVDIAPALLDRAAQRAVAEQLEVSFGWADALHLPQADGTLDVTASSIGVMFAADQQRAADELLRVTRPGGRIALASWTPEGFVGRMLRTVVGYLDLPAGALSPVRWGSPQGLHELFGDRVAWSHLERVRHRMSFPDVRSASELFATRYGPTVRALERLSPTDGAALLLDLEALVLSQGVDAPRTATWDQEYLIAVGAAR